MITRGKLNSRHFFFFILGITLIGFFIFSSASLGLLNRPGASYSRIFFNQLLTLIVSLVAMIGMANFDYRRLRQFALPIFLISLGISFLVFVPGIGFSSGGASRWISLGDRTFQPSELLKLAFIIYLAAWLSKTNNQLVKWQYGILPFGLLLAVTGLSLVAEPDLGTFSILTTAAVAMFFVAGARWRHLGLILLVGLSTFALLIATKPYARERILTFLNPEKNVQTSSYQINQALISIGSGGWLGQGFGRSFQKFRYLPEPIGDSIFAVAGEEFGFVGGFLIIGSFTIFLLWGLTIARQTHDRFGRLLITGIVILITTGAFVNIASMLALFPLTGIPLVFISHGGSSLLLSLVGCGIILNVAKHERKTLI